MDLDIRARIEWLGSEASRAYKEMSQYAGECAFALARKQVSAAEHWASLWDSRNTDRMGYIREKAKLQDELAKLETIDFLPL